MSIESSSQEPLFRENVTYTRDLPASQQGAHPEAEYITLTPEEIDALADDALRETLQDASSHGVIRDGWLRIIVANPDNTLRHVAAVPVRPRTIVPSW